MTPCPLRSTSRVVFAANVNGLLERDGSQYAYRLTEKGIRVALLFTLFHRQPTQLHTPPANSKPLMKMPTPPFNSS